MSATPQFANPGTYINVPIETDPDALAQDAFDYLEAKTGGLWEPHDGQLDTWVIEANARMASTVRDIASDVPRTIFRYFGSLVNIPPIEATAATALLDVTAVDAAGYMIPAYTNFGIDDGFGNLKIFETSDDLFIPAGATIYTALPVSAVDEGVDSSGIGTTGGPVVLLDDLAWVQDVTLESPTTGGVDEEDDDDYLNRLTQNLRLLAPRPILAADFALLAKNIVGVYRALALDGFDPATSSSTTKTAAVTVAGNTTLSGLGTSYTGINVNALVIGPGIPAGTYVQSTNPAAGTLVMTNPANLAQSGISVTFLNGFGNAREVTVAVADISGNVVSSATKTAVGVLLTSNREPGFLINVVDPTYTTIDVHYDITHWPNWDPVDVKTRVEAAIAGWYSPVAWGNPQGGDVNLWYPLYMARLNDLVSAIGAVQGVQDVNLVTQRVGTDAYAASDIVLGGAAPLPRLGVIEATSVVR